MKILDEIDNNILRVLDRTTVSASELARELGVGRTMLRYRLIKFEEAGMVKRRVSGRRTLWEREVPRSHNKNHFRVYRGVRFPEAYRGLFSLPKDSHIYCIQGSQAARGEFLSLPASFLKEGHRVFKRRRFVLKVISNEKVNQECADINRELLKSHIGRTLGAKLFSDDRFLGEAEILSASGFLLLSNPEAKEATVIKEKAVAQIVYETLDFVFELTDFQNSFDLNRYLKQKITSTQESNNLEH